MMRAGFLKALAGGVLLTLVIGLFTEVDAGHRRRCCRSGYGYGGYTTAWNQGQTFATQQTACAVPNAQSYDGAAQPGAYGQPMDQPGQPAPGGFQAAPPPPPPQNQE